MATPMKKKSPPKKVVTKTGERISTAYCRRCMKNLPPGDFYQATDTYLDCNGLTSVCKTCVNETYYKFYETELSSEKVILRLCRMLNVRYLPEAVNATKGHVETMKENRGVKSVTGVFGIYLNKLRSMIRSLDGQKINEVVSDMGYVDISGIIKFEEIDYTDKVERDVLVFWGTGYKAEDYEWLENEYDEWTKTHKSDTKAEQVLLKEIVYKQYEIKKARQEERATGGLTKELQELMKTASYDPAKTSIAGSGKAQDTFSGFIKTIEETEPAEYYKDPNMFKDYANIESYFNKFVVRPLKNFVTGSRDFNIEDPDNEPEDEDFEDDEFEKFKNSLEEG